MKRPGYMMVKEAAVRYGVSRAKLHRLVRLGRLQTAKDPRDERATLLRTEDLEALFRFPAKGDEDMSYHTRTTNVMKTSGRLTGEWRERLDALRVRISAGRRFAPDSAEIIRQERERRTRQINRAVFGDEDEGDSSGLEA